MLKKKEIIICLSVVGIRYFAMYSLLFFIALNVGSYRAQKFIEIDLTLPFHHEIFDIFASSIQCIDDIHIKYLHKFTFSSVHCSSMFYFITLSIFGIFSELFSVDVR